MADTKISGMAALAGADVADGDLLPIVDISAAAGAKNKTLTPVEARIALVTAAAIEAALGYEPATAAQGALADTAVQSATVGTGNATTSLVAQTATGDATTGLGAVVTTLGDALYQVGATAVTGNATVSTTATVSTLGAATANTTATAATGDAIAYRLATTGTGDAFANTEALITGAGGAEACVDAEVQTPDGDSDSLARIRATAGAHVTSVSATATSTGSTLEVAIEGDVGAAGQFTGSDGAGTVLWQTPLVRHAAGVPTGAPGVAELPIAFDSTAVSGGFYFWDGAAWVKCSTIP